MDYTNINHWQSTASCDTNYRPTSMLTPKTKSELDMKEELVCSRKYTRKLLDRTFDERDICGNAHSVDDISQECIQPTVEYRSVIEGGKQALCLNNGSQNNSISLTDITFNSLPQLSFTNIHELIKPSKQLDVLKSRAESMLAPQQVNTCAIEEVRESYCCENVGIFNDTTMEETASDKEIAKASYIDRNAAISSGHNICDNKSNDNFNVPLSQVIQEVVSKQLSVDNTVPDGMQSRYSDSSGGNNITSEQCKDYILSYSGIETCEADPTTNLEILKHPLTNRLTPNKTDHSKSETKLKIKPKRQKRFVFNKEEKTAAKS